jgi:hypothetical protein
MLSIGKNDNKNGVFKQKIRQKIDLVAQMI